MWCKTLTFLHIFHIHFLGFPVLGDNATETIEKIDFTNQSTATEIFNKTNSDIHKALNEVFDLLRLPSESTENGTLKKLLTTYGELKKVNTIGHKIYQDIEQLTRVNKTMDNATINFVVDINELTLETLLNHLKKRMPKSVKYQEDSKSKVEDKNADHTRDTAKENYQNFQYLATINISQYQETNLSFSLDKISSVANDIWGKSGNFVNKSINKF